MVDKKLNKKQVKKLTNAKQAAIPALSALTGLVEKSNDEAMKPHVPQYIVEQARTAQEIMQNMMPQIETAIENAKSPDPAAFVHSAQANALKAVEAHEKLVMIVGEEEKFIIEDGSSFDAC